MNWLCPTYDHPGGLGQHGSPPLAHHDHLCIGFIDDSLMNLTPDRLKSLVLDMGTYPATTPARGNGRKLTHLRSKWFPLFDH